MLGHSITSYNHIVDCLTEAIELTYNIIEEVHQSIRVRIISGEYRNGKLF
jgi:hypothetical protein